MPLVYYSKVTGIAELIGVQLCKQHWLLTPSATENIMAACKAGGPGRSCTSGVHGLPPWLCPLSRAGKIEPETFLFDHARSQLPGTCPHPSAGNRKSVLSFQGPAVLPQHGGQAGTAGESQGWFLWCWQSIRLLQTTREPWAKSSKGLSKSIHFLRPSSTWIITWPFHMSC